MNFSSSISQVYYLAWACRIAVCAPCKVTPPTTAHCTNNARIFFLSPLTKSLHPKGKKKLQIFIPSLLTIDRLFTTGGWLANAKGAAKGQEEIQRENTGKGAAEEGPPAPLPFRCHCHYQSGKVQGPPAPSTALFRCGVPPFDTT